MTLINKLKWLIKELILVLSNKPSFFSIKRLGRTALFNAALLINLDYYRNHRTSISTQEILMITGAFFTYAGFNAVMNRQEKVDELKSQKDDNKNNNPQEVIPEKPE